jgi:hypothetical protein
VQTTLPRRRVVLTVFGSLGELHPYIAIALGLKARGHEAIIATCAAYQQKIEALGLGFRPVRPDIDAWADPKAMERFMTLRLGMMRGVREALLPVLRESYEDVLAAAQGADLLVPHPLTYATRFVAEKTGIPWASTMITPLGFFSAHDLPVIPLAPGLSSKLRCLGPVFWGPFLRLGKWATRSWAAPLYRLRAELGLPPTREANPLGDGHSPALVLALFSKLLANQQPDWPPPDRPHRLPVVRPAWRSRLTTAPGPLPRRGLPAGRLHARVVGGHGRRPVLRIQRYRRATAEAPGCPHHRQLSSQPAPLATRRRGCL